MKRLSRAAVTLASAAAVGFSLAHAVAPALAGQPENPGAKSARKSSLYIVQMTGDPVVAYRGGIAGLAATRPRAGQKIDPLDSRVAKYKDFLTARHNAALQSVGGARKAYSYGFVFNGFAAELSDAQVTALRASKDVVAVSPDEIRKLDTISTPAFLGLDAAGGFWEAVGGRANAGEGIVVGIVDSGIWPENPSFSDRDKNGKLVFQQIPGWNGKCTPGEAFPASKCNQKLTTAQWFNEGFGGAAGVKATFPYEYNSARGADGHGSHTASTAAGNAGVDAIVDGINLGKISGMAPRARLAIYKACWGFGSDDAGGCASVDTVAAIDQAVADGVDVINYSISGSLANFLDPVEVAFLFAADAGVFVAASAGNSGPTSSTVAHNSPWLATVAAGTHDRQYTATATLGNGVAYPGAGLGSAVPSRPLILSDAAGLPGVNAGALALCFPDTLDPVKVAGKIVVCDRGVNARTEKSESVMKAGGFGMILVNTSVNSLNADLHYVPTVHLQSTERAAIRAYAQASNATAQLSKGQSVSGAVASDVASFSSRGPALAGAGDLLKPDIMAPGVDVLAAVSPIETGRDFDFYSGTSMSSPHIAGIAALMKQRYPTWSPAAIKSALMTTATTLRNDRTAIPGSPFGYGAGHVQPNKALDPGLVYDSGFDQWLAFLCGTGELTASYCPSIARDPSDLNYPSIAVGALAGSQTVTRTVTNVTGKNATFSASVQAPGGFDVKVTPATLTLAARQSKSFTVTLTRTTAALNAYAFGVLTWSDGIRSVRSPIVVRPIAISAPGQINGTGGSLSFQVAFGYTGAYSAGTHGLNLPTKFVDTVNDDPTNTFVRGGPGTRSFQVEVPAGTALARFSLFDAFTDGNDDLDLYVYQGATLVGASGAGTSAEEVNLVLPTAGTYTVYVHGWQTDGPSANFTLFTWNVGLVDNKGNMTVSAPTAAQTGTTGTVNLTFNGLLPGTKYLGAVSHSEGASLRALTVVAVDTP